LIGDVAWGYNRDGEKLPQINVCMLVGEKSKLPIFSIVYNGAIKDVSTLKTTLEVASGLDLKNIFVITDKGFSSKKNVDGMLADTSEFKFMMSLPFSLAFAKNQVESERKDIDSFDNTIVLGNDTLRGITKHRSWDTKHKLHTHIFFNPILANARRNELYGYITTLKEAAISDPENEQLTAEFEKYLIIRKSMTDTKKVTVTVREAAIEHELSHTGWMIAVSNYEHSAKEALSIYREKDVVEKGFQRLKNCIDLARLRVRSDTAMQNKIFIGFISLILTAHIHKTMSDRDLYKNLTMKKMLKSLETLRVQYIKGQRILYPPTKQHKAIFEAFGLPLPV
jgi:transposase